MTAVNIWNLCCSSESRIATCSAGSVNNHTCDLPVILKRWSWRPRQPYLADCFLQFVHAFKYLSIWIIELFQSIFPFFACTSCVLYMAPHYSLFLWLRCIEKIDLVTTQDTRLAARCQSNSPINKNRTYTCKGVGEMHWYVHFCFWQLPIHSCCGRLPTSATHQPMCHSNASFDFSATFQESIYLVHDYPALKINTGAN